MNLRSIDPICSMSFLGIAIHHHFMWVNDHEFRLSLPTLCTFMLPSFDVMDGFTFPVGTCDFQRRPLSINSRPIDVKFCLFDSVGEITHLPKKVRIGWLGGSAYRWNIRCCHFSVNAWHFSSSGPTDQTANWLPPTIAYATQFSRMMCFLWSSFHNQFSFLPAALLSSFHIERITHWFLQMC